MSETTKTTNLIERMFKAGAHFAFSRSRRHPSTSPYIFATKQGFDIFDLEKTSALVEDAKTYLKEAGAQGKRLLLVGTKEEIAQLIRTESVRAEVPFVANRWVGGSLTNFSEIKKRIQYLLTLRGEKETGELDRKYTKKERLMLQREMDRLEHSFEGILSLEQAPGLLLVVDPRHEAIAVAEAQQSRIPVVALMSSDCNVREITKPVVVNDAQRASVALILAELLNAYTEGRAQFVPKTPVAPQKAATQAK